MTYTVIWKRSVQDKLAEIWLASENRVAITVAADEIDQLLRRHPQSGDVVVANGVRFLNVGALNVLFSIIEDDRKVIVRAVWLAEFKPRTDG